MGKGNRVASALFSAMSFPLIQYDGVTLIGGTKTGENVWRDDAQDITYALVSSTEDGQSVQTLFIVGASGQVQLNHRSAGRFGLDLVDPTPADLLPLYAGTSETEAEATSFYDQPHTVIDADGEGPQQFTAIGGYGEVLNGNDSVDRLTFNGAG